MKGKEEEVKKPVARDPNEKVFADNVTHGKIIFKKGDPVPEALLKEKILAPYITTWEQVRPEVEHLTLEDEVRKLRAENTELKKRLAAIEKGK